MQVGVSFGREHDDIENLFAVPSLETLHGPDTGDTYTEDGTDGSGFDGGPDEPFDDGVGP